MKKNPRFMVGLVGVAAVVTYLIWTGVSETMVYYLTPVELLERLLEKSARNRLSGISDARVEIERVLADPRGVLVRPATAAAPASLRSKLPWVAAAVLVDVAAEELIRRMSGRWVCRAAG